MDKLLEYWNLISIWRKAAYFSVFGTLLWILYGLINPIITILNNKTGVYDCGISFKAPCGLWEYILRSDSSTVFYISIVVIFVLLLILSNLISLLIWLYQKENKSLFWIILIAIVLVLISLPFVFKYLQYVM